MTAVQLKVTVLAVKSRLSKGEDFDEIMDSYPRLTEEDVNELIVAIYGDEGKPE